MELKLHRQCETIIGLLTNDKFVSNRLFMKQNLANSIILPPKHGGLKAWSHSARNANSLKALYRISNELRGPSTLTWELRTGDCKITLEDKQKIGNLTYYISSESLRDAESE